jgi:hypothetical protein
MCPSKRPRRYANNHPFKYGISVTRVAVDEDRVAGFVTVTATTVSREAIPSARSHRYPCPRCSWGGSPWIHPPRDTGFSER